jgi:hypothetical protein
VTLTDNICVAVFGVMIKFTITIAKDNQGGTGAAFTLNAEKVDQTEADLLTQYLSEQGMTLAENMNDLQLKRTVLTQSV